MFCRQVQSQLDDYILDQVSRELFDQIDNHLRECLECRKQLETNRQIISTLKSMTTPDPGDFYWQQLENTVLARTFDKNRQEINLTEQVGNGPIGILQRYLIPLAASFLILFGSLFYADRAQEPIQFSSWSMDRTTLYMAAQNSPVILDGYDSQTFTTIVAGAPGSLGLHLVFANIGGGSR